MNVVFKGIMWALEALVGKLGKTLIAMVMSCASEKFMQWAILDVAERIVKSTKNTTDDEWFAKIKSQIETVKE